MDKILKSKVTLITSLIGVLSIFALLFYRAPYSERTLVGNLEPYPDTLFYSRPAWNLVHGSGYTMQAYGYKTKIATPPVYSLYLAPFFATFDDVRSFYFANIILAFLSVGLLLLTIRRLFGGKYWAIYMFLGGFLYLTNYYIFTLPTLLMAENITITLFLGMFYLVVEKTTKKNSIIAGILGMLLLGAKFSNLPLMVSFYLIYAWKIYKEKSIRSSEFKYYIITTSIAGIVFLAYIITSGILVGHKNLGTSNSFNLSYLMPNLQTYLHTLIGRPASFLWFYYPMVSSYIGALSIIGVTLGLLLSQFRTYIGYLLIIMFVHLLFGSSFYATDSRYIIVLYPIMIFFICFGIQTVFKRTSVLIASVVTVTIIGLYLAIPSFGQILSEPLVITLKKQVGINFRHAQVPWHMIAAQEWHEFAKQQDAKIYIGTFLPPYFIHYYVGDDISYMPITPGQEFFYDKVDQSHNYAGSLIDYYTSLLEQGNNVYVSSYYSTNIFGWDKRYNELVSNFKVELAHEGCLGVCNLYQLNIKK